MKITCNNCEDVIGGYLCDLPSEWRKQIANVICKFLNPTVPLNCTDVKKCETLTTLSAFSISGSQVCIDYTDENGSTVHRCFNMAEVGLNLDPKCIMSQEDWDVLTWEQKIQAIIDYSCSCQSPQVSCTCYTVHNLETETGTIEYVVNYIDCEYAAQSTPLAHGDSISFCATTGSVSTNFTKTITNNGDCGDDCPPLG